MGPGSTTGELNEKPSHPHCSIILQETSTLAQQIGGCVAIHAYETEMRQAGLKESTIRARVKTLKRIAKRTNILNATGVTAFLATVNWQQNTKEKRIEDLLGFYKFKQITWNRPKCQRIGKLPMVPLEGDVDQLIQTLQKMRRGQKPATFVQFEKETGARSSEAWGLKWTDIDFERALVNITPKKGSDPRQLRISQKLIGMMNALDRSSCFVFHRNSPDELQSLDNFRRTFEHQRRKATEELDNPRLMQITFKSLRHFKATMEYAKTRDILHVQRILGHRNIRNTLVYTHLVNFDSDEWICKVAATVDEMKWLIEHGFEYVTDKDGLKVFRKRK